MLKDDKFKKKMFNIVTQFFRRLGNGNFFLRLNEVSVVRHFVLSTKMITFVSLS